MKKFDNYVSHLRVLERADKEMLKDRNDTSHIYDGNAAKELLYRILERYIPQFKALETELVKHYGDLLKNM